MENKEEPIDLNRLNQRETLILIATDVREIKNSQKEYDSEQRRQALQINTLETRSKVWSGAIGFLTALLMIIIEKLLEAL